MTQKGTDIICCIKAIKQEMLRQFDSLEERVIAMENYPSQPVLIQPENTGWLTARDLARHFKVSPSTVYTWAERKIIPAGIPFGKRQTRWKLSDVEICLKSTGDSPELPTGAKHRGRPSKIRRKEEFYA